MPITKHYITKNLELRVNIDISRDSLTLINAVLEQTLEMANNEPKNMQQMFKKAIQEIDSKNVNSIPLTEESK